MQREPCTSVLKRSSSIPVTLGTKLLAFYFSLERLYRDPNDPDQREEDDKSLIFKLVEKQYGAAENWTKQNVDEVCVKYMKFMPAAFIKNLSADAVASSINNLREVSLRP